MCRQIADKLGPEQNEDEEEEDNDDMWNGGDSFLTPGEE